MVLVFCPQYHHRLVYVLDEIIEHRLGDRYQLVHDVDLYISHDADLKWHFSNLDLPGFRIPDSGKLWATKLEASGNDYADSEGIPVLFPVECPLGFDMFAMAFWFLALCDEYRETEKDRHGRTLAANMLPAKFTGFETPVLDAALQQFFKKMGLQGKNKFAIYPTIDIDIAFKHRGKTRAQQIGGLAKLFLQFRFVEAAEKIRVFLGKKDPWDTYEYLTEVLQKHKDNTRIFIHSGSRSQFDKPVSLRHRLYAKRLDLLKSNFTIGLHPSYSNGQSAEGIKLEKIRLEQNLKLPITRSRQHFLRLNIPETLRQLAASGIKHDYTLGFAETIGFRAGTGHAFRFYDLEKEESTQLVLHPFCLMDVAMKNYMHLPEKTALEKIKTIKETCRQNGTPFSFIFHNESVSDSGEWNGWKKVFEACLE